MTSERDLERARQWRAANRERVAAYNREYRQANGEELAARAAERYQERREEIVDARRDRRVSDPAFAAAEREQRRAHYAKNAAQIKARVHAWQKADRRRKFAAFANRKAKQLDVPGHIDWRDLPALPRPCHYCGAEAWGFDHVNPFVAGGPNTIDNLVPCCLPCNERKNRFPVVELVSA